MSAHHHHDESGFYFSIVSLMLITLALTMYLIAAGRQRRAGKHWSNWRCAAFVVGAGLLALAVLPPLMAFGHYDLRGHMLQHLVIGMLAPLALVLSSPVSLLLRSIPSGAARCLVGLLHSQPVRIISHPVTTVFLNVGGMYVLYMTPLYALSLTSPTIHYLIHVHFLIAGYLFTWAILAGPDPAPNPTSMAFRLGALLVSMATHAILGKLMYGYHFPRNTHHEIEEIQAAAQWMYYGGDFAEILLVVTLFAMWYRARGVRPYSLQPLLNG